MAKSSNTLPLVRTASGIYDKLPRGGRTRATHSRSHENRQLDPRPTCHHKGKEPARSAPEQRTDLLHRSSYGRYFMIQTPSL